MLHRTGLISAILTIFVLIVALQLQNPDSTFMRLLNLSLTSLQARRAFTGVSSRSSDLSTPVTKMASSDKNEQASFSVAEADVKSGDQVGGPLGLPAPGDDEAIKLDMSSGGDTVRLDSLGPMVVNQDGSISRIGNWNQMTEMEQKNTLRIVGKRNKQRLDALKAAEDGTADGK